MSGCKNLMSCLELRSTWMYVKLQTLVGVRKKGKQDVIHPCFFVLFLKAVQSRPIHS